MQYNFQLQDPTSGGMLYLGEVLLDALRDAQRCRAVFAFASLEGTRMLFSDPVVEAFLRRGRFDLVVGIDAVTNRAALEHLQELEAAHGTLRARVFWNPTSALFHPKFVHLVGRGGRQTIIVGSGNLTAGGLRRNFEAFSVLRFDRGDSVDVAALNSFFRAHARDLREIDAEALARAARNVVRSRRRRGRVIKFHEIPEMPLVPRERARGTVTERVLVAQLPRAGDRWHQAHFNIHVVQQFFRVDPDASHRAFLVERRLDGSLGEQEMRPCVYSPSNRNLKIELAARRGVDYPETGGRPIAVFKEIQVRTFEYMILLPGEPGYDGLRRLTETLPSLGRGLPRVLTDVAALRRAWPDSPLV